IVLSFITYFRVLVWRIDSRLVIISWPRLAIFVISWSSVDFSVRSGGVPARAASRRVAAALGLAGGRPSGEPSRVAREGLLLCPYGAVGRARWRAACVSLGAG
ncbi:hypothetical protein KI387_034188, partial [Taxus chinensis]